MDIWVWALASLNSKVIRSGGRCPRGLRTLSSAVESSFGGAPVSDAPVRCRRCAALCEEFEQVLPVKAELDLVACVFGLDDLAALALFAGLGGDLDLAFADGQADRAVAFVGDERHAADGGPHLVEVKDGSIVVVLWHDHLVIGKLPAELAGDEQAALGLEIDVVRVLAKCDLAVTARELDELEQSLFRDERIHHAVFVVDRASRHRRGDGRRS